MPSALAFPQRLVWRGLRSVYPLLLFLLAWEAVTRGGLVRPLFLPPFTVVLRQLDVVAANGELLPPLATSRYRTVAGLMLAGAVGVPLGFLLVRSRIVRWMFEPLVGFGM